MLQVTNQSCLNEQCCCGCHAVQVLPILPINAKAAPTVVTYTAAASSMITNYLRFISSMLKITVSLTVVALLRLVFSALARNKSSFPLARFHIGA